MEKVTGFTRSITSVGMGLLLGILAGVVLGTLVGAGLAMLLGVI
jgi:hypothetical protein